MNNKLAKRKPQKKFTIIKDSEPNKVKKVKTKSSIVGQYQHIKSPFILRLGPKSKARKNLLYYDPFLQHAQVVAQRDLDEQFWRHCYSERFLLNQQRLLEMHFSEFPQERELPLSSPSLEKAYLEAQKDLDLEYAKFYENIESLSLGEKDVRTGLYPSAKSYTAVLESVDQSAYWKDEFMKLDQISFERENDYREQVVHKKKIILQAGELPSTKDLLCVNVNS